MTAKVDQNAGGVVAESSLLSQANDPRGPPSPPLAEPRLSTGASCLQSIYHASTDCISYNGGCVFGVICLF